MRMIFAVLCVLSLAGCVSPQQQAARARAEEAADDARCQDMGYKLGTELYLKCRDAAVRLRIEANRVQDAQTQAQAQARVQALQNAGAALTAAGAPPAMPPMQQPMHCTTTPSIYGSPQYGSNTNCY